MSLDPLSLAEQLRAKDAHTAKLAGTLAHYRAWASQIQVPSLLCDMSYGLPVHPLVLPRKLSQAYLAQCLCQKSDNDVGFAPFDLGCSLPLPKASSSRVLLCFVSLKCNLLCILCQGSMLEDSSRSILVSSLVCSLADVGDG